MKYILENGPFIKSNNSVDKINVNILISLIPIFIYKTFLTGYGTLLTYFLITMFNLSVLVVLDLIIYRKNYKFNVNNYIHPISLSLIIYLFIIRIDSILLTLLINLGIIVLNKFVKHINPISIKLIIIYILSNELIVVKYNLWIIAGILFLSLFYLTLTKSIKFRVTITFISLVLLSLLFNNHNNMIIPLIASVFILPIFESVPLYFFGQYLYGIIFGIIYIIFGFEALAVIIFVMSLLAHYLDLYYSFYLAKK